MYREKYKGTGQMEVPSCGMGVLEEEGGGGQSPAPECCLGLDLFGQAYCVHESRETTLFCLFTQ